MVILQGQSMFTKSIKMNVWHAPNANTECAGAGGDPGKWLVPGWWWHGKVQDKNEDEMDVSKEISELA